MKALGVSLLMLLAIAPAPANEAPDNSREISGEVDAVWSDIIDVFAIRGIPLATVDKDAGIVVSEPAAVSDPSLADCGQLSWGEKVLEFSAEYSVLVRHTNSSSQQVTVASEYVQERWSMVKDDVHDVPCESTGAFEAALLDEWQRRSLSHQAGT